jgi:hypothetical protein
MEIKMTKPIEFLRLPEATVVITPLRPAEVDRFNKEILRHITTMHKIYSKVLGGRGVELTAEGEDKDGNSFFLLTWNDVRFIGVLEKGVDPLT